MAALCLHKCVCEGQAQLHLCLRSHVNINTVLSGSVSGGDAPFFTVSTPPESPGSSAKAPGHSGMCARRGLSVPKWANLLPPG